MKIKQIFKLIDDVQIGEIFQFEDEIWIKTNVSHNTAGFQCVELSSGNLSYISKKTPVTEVRAELQVFTPCK